jgi:hypothetical protein
VSNLVDHVPGLVSYVQRLVDDILRLIDGTGDLASNVGRVIDDVPPLARDTGGLTDLTIALITCTGTISGCSPRNSDCIDDDEAQERYWVSCQWGVRFETVSRVRS